MANDPGPQDVEEGGQKCIHCKQQLQVPLLASPSTQGRGCKEEHSPPALPLPHQKQATPASDQSPSHQSPFRAAAASARLDFLPFLALLLMVLLWSGSTTADLLLSVSTVVLLALLYFLAMVCEKIPKDQIQMRGRLKAAVLLGSAGVNFISAYRVTAFLPFAFAVWVWCAAGAYTATVLCVCLVRGADSPAVADGPHGEGEDGAAKCPV